MNKKIIVFSTALLFSVFLSCFASAQVTTVEPLGEVRGGKYLNPVFGFEFDVPSGWYVAGADDADTIKRYVREGERDYKVRSRGNTSAENISLMISRDTLGSSKNTAIGFSVIRQPSEKITAAMIAEATKPLFVGRNGTTLEKDTTNEMIGGKSFATFDLLVVSTLGRQYVRVYTTMIGLNTITFVLTYWGEDDRRLLEKSVRSIRFTK